MPDGLRAADGYASYGGCGSSLQGCTGAVPTGLRRPLHVGRLAAGATCPEPTGRIVTRFLGPLLGPGPVYPVSPLDQSGSMPFVYPPPRTGESNFAGSQWGGQKVLWAAAPGYRGPVLIRGRQLDGPHAAGFGADRVPVAEMQLLSAGAFSPGEPPGWREWPSFTRLRAGGCYAFQIDGTTFSTVIVLRATPSATRT